MRESFFDCDFRWDRCASCSFVFQNPKLTLQSLHHIYSSPTYWQAGDETSDSGRPVGYMDYTEGENYRLMQSRYRIRTVERFLPKGSQLLDVACASGFFSKVARECGYEAWGIELSPQLAAYGREQYGLRIEAEDFDTYDIQPASLDGVTLWGCDSNFYDPVATFCKVNRVLRPGGFTFFNFWDFDHFTRPLLGKFKISYSALHQFNQVTLRAALEKAGLRIRSKSMEWSYGSVEAILALTCRMSLLKLARRLGLAKVVLRIPTLSGFVVAAEKVRDL